jgi:phosphinothricin acetyltransferase
MLIRLADVGDAAGILAIYKPFVEASATSFETNAPTTDEFAGRITACIHKYPWLVAVVNGTIAGYAYATKHRAREAYQWSVESSVYVHPAFYRQGIARLLYQKLFSLLKAQGFINVFAVIALPNQASINLHKESGFEEIGVYKKAGFKLGKWHDVKWLVKYINEHSLEPLAPKSIQSINHLLSSR